jgi:hypothetical protein
MSTPSTQPSSQPSMQSIDKPSVQPTYYFGYQPSTLPWIIKQRAKKSMSKKEYNAWSFVFEAWLDLRRGEHDDDDDDDKYEFFSFALLDYENFVKNLK